MYKGNPLKEQYQNIKKKTTKNIFREKWCMELKELSLDSEIDI